MDIKEFKNTDKLSVEWLVTIPSSKINIELDKKYFDFLSDASKISLRLQGGVLNAKESREFENKSYFKPSILLLKFDEAAKRTDIKMKSIHDYEKLLSSKLI